MLVKFGLGTLHRPLLLAVGSLGTRSDRFGWLKTMHNQESQ
jgi:hypothetical protein